MLSCLLNMKVLVALSLLAVVKAGPASAPIAPYRYHELVGIPRATAIRAAEEAALKNPGSRILNGTPATLGQFPFYGGLITTMASGRTSSCGSSLVTSTKLVTAAHCWTDGSDIGTSVTVVLGSLMLFFGGTRIETSDVDLHEGWLLNGWDFRDDIAIITISAVEFNDFIRPIALASGSNDYAGQTAQAIGMGMTSNTAAVGTHTFLAHVSLPVMSNDACNLFYPGFVTPNIVCTQSVNGGNICTGDSGGPIAVGNFLVGVVSFQSSLGCEALMPAGHSRVSTYLSWILSRL